MNTELLECAGCGAPLDASAAKDGLCRCKYCAYVNVMPKADQKDEVLLLLHDGESELRNSSFERAYNAFKRASELSPDESRAYFGMALAANRVKYIRDVVNNRCQPICFEVTDKRFDSDKNYSIALDYAETDAQYNEYLSRAREIDYIREKFSDLKNTNPRYDTFICVKVTEKDGSFTQDSQWATRLYDAIKRAGYTPFYSERDVGDRLGEDYEAIILYALFCAKSMIIVCSNEDYLRTPWVQNEYSRYYAMLTENEKKANSITIAFNDTVIERIPGIRGKIEGVNLKSFDASQKICEFVGKFSKPEKKEVKRVKLCVNCGAECDVNIKFCSECGSSAFANDRAELIKLREQAEKMKRENEEKLREQAELRAKQELEARIKEAEERARRDAEEKARRDAEEAERRAREEKAIRDAEAKAKAEAEEKARREREALEEKQREELERKLKEAEMRAQTASAGAAVSSASPSLAGGKYCIKCGTANDSDSKFCSSCGGTQFSDTNAKYCASCDAKNAITTKYCVKCGGARFVMTEAELKTLHAEEEERKRKEEEARREQARKESAYYAAKSLIKDVAAEAESARTRITKAKNEDQLMWRYGCKTTSGRLASCSCSARYFQLPDYGEYAVTVIGRSAFASSNAVAVLIPNTVKSIEAYAFAGCKTLEYVFMPSSVTFIGEGAFKGCTSLKYVSLSSGINSIPSSAFDGCSSLKGLDIPSGVTSIAANAFSGCSSLLALSMPYNLKSNFTKLYSDIDARVIAYYNAREKMAKEAEERRAREAAEAEERKKREAIEAEARKKREEEMAKLAEIFDIKDGALITYHKDEVNLKLPTCVTKVAANLTIVSKKTRSLEIPANITEIEPRAFTEFNNLAEVTVDKDNPAFKAENGVVYTKDGKEVVFCCPAKRGSVTIPNGVIKIRDSAFNMCTHVTEIKIPDTVKMIEKVAFGEIGAQSIVIPKGVTSIPLLMLCGSAVKRVTLPDTIERIGEAAFSDCKNLEEITIPNSVISIADKAFANCTSLKSLVIPEGLETLGDGIIEGCTAIKSVSIPFLGETYDTNDGADIGYLYGCAGDAGEIPAALKTVTISQGSIASSYFCGASNIEKVYLSRDEYSVEAEAFVGCSSLVEINAHKDSDLTTINGDIYDCDGTEIYKYAIGKPDKTYNAPKDLVFVGKEAFEGATKLERVNLSNKVERIGDRAFAFCTNLKEIVIPASVNNIGSYAFYDTVKKIYCEAKKPLFGVPKGWAKDWCSKSTQVIWGYKK